jgi:adenylate kinase family enzyme
MIYVCAVGGPGSNKSSLCQKVLRANNGWGHISVGLLLRSQATSQEQLQDTISSGQIVDEVIFKSLTRPVYVIIYRNDNAWIYFVTVNRARNIRQRTVKIQKFGGYRN